MKTDTSKETCQITNITLGNVHANYDAIADNNWMLYKKIDTGHSNNVSEFRDVVKACIVKLEGGWGSEYLTDYTIANVI